MGHPFTTGVKTPPDSKLLARKVKLVTSYDVGLLGSSSKSGADVYVDRSFAAAVRAGKVLVNGKPFPYFFKALEIHEKVEKQLEDLGWSYTDAHRYATKLENAFVESKGFKAKDYQAAYKPWIIACGRKTNPREAPNMEEKPYLHPHNVEQRKLLAAANDAEHEKAA